MPPRNFAMKTMRQRIEQTFHRSSWFYRVGRTINFQPSAVGKRKKNARSRGEKRLCGSVRSHSSRIIAPVILPGRPKANSTSSRLSLLKFSSPIPRTAIERTRADKNVIALSSRRRFTPINLCNSSPGSRDHCVLTSFPNIPRSDLFTGLR